MAKTQAQYKTILETEKATKSSLDVWIIGANKAWRAWLNLISYVTNLVDVIWDTQKVAIEAQADLVQPYTMEWYRQKVITSQTGDSIEIIDGDWTYETIDTEKQTVKVCVLHEAALNLQYPEDTAIVSHCATVDSAGDYVVEPSLGALVINKIMSSGSAQQDQGFLWTAVTNLAVDADIYYDTELLTSAGALKTDTTVFPVVDAINKYVDEYVNVTGYFKSAVLRSYIQDAVGVLAIDLTDEKYDKDGDTSYTDVVREFHNKRVVQYLRGGAASLLTYTT